MSALAPLKDALLVAGFPIASVPGPSDHPLRRPTSAFDQNHTNGIFQLAAAGISAL
jgi:hypothetical protein